MIKDVFRCSQLFSDVFSWVVPFMDNHPLCDAKPPRDDVRCFQMFLGCPHRYSIEILRCVQDVLSCSQMFTDVFQMIRDVFGFSLDIL